MRTEICETRSSKVPTAVLVKFQVVWDVTPCRQVTVYGRFEALLCLHLQGQTVSLFYVHMTVHRNNFLFSETNRRTNFQIYSGTQLYMFRAAPLPIIRSYPLYIRAWHILCRFDDCKRTSDLHKMWNKYGN